MTTFNQTQEIQDFVRREVIYCVSSLIDSLRSAVFNGSGIEGFTEDDYYAICVQDDWETAARENGWEQKEDGQIYKDIEGDEENEPGERLADDWRDACEQDDIDSYSVEAYEHWIVTDWFASKLEEKGEMVARDICGLTVWGRTTTGQAIFMDSVIQSIYNDLHGE